MLVLLSFALVLVATVLLVLGLLNDGLGLIYVSIASSVAAAAALIVALRMNKARTGDQPSVAPSLSDPESDRERITPAVPEVATSTSAPTSGTDWLAEEADWPADEDNVDGEDEVDFPIADYDSLSIAQILPLLPQLYSDEIEVVEEREQQTKARPKILAKLAELRDGSTATDTLATYTEDAAGTADWDDEDWFPIEDYESLSGAQILTLLPELDDEELTLVRTRELSLGRRRSLLDEIDRMLGTGATKAPAKKAPSKKKAPAKKA
ncbi:MAG: hypothetical protein WD691_10610, partial [Acidimicrobiales bacterium]